MLGRTGQAQILGATAYDGQPKILLVRTTTSPGTHTNRKLLTSKNFGLLKYVCLLLFFFFSDPNSRNRRRRSKRRRKKKAHDLHMKAIFRGSLGLRRSPVGCMCVCVHNEETVGTVEKAHLVKRLLFKH